MRRSRECAKGHQVFLARRTALDLELRQCDVQGPAHPRHGGAHREAAIGRKRPRWVANHHSKLGAPSEGEGPSLRATFNVLPTATTLAVNFHALRLAVLSVEDHNFDSSNCCRSPIHILASSASSFLARSGSPRALWSSASPYHDQPLAGARFSARSNCSSASSRRPACISATASDCRTG